MSSNLMPNANITPAAETPKTLEQVLKGNEELHSENQKLREATHRMNARLSALTEENEELRKERDSYKEQLVEAKEQHEAELRELTEEMAAAARFTEKEWREHCDGVEAEVRRLRGVVAILATTALELLGEEAARQKLQDEEGKERSDLQGPQWKASLKKVPAREAARVKAVFAARGLSMKKLRRTHLGKGPADWCDSYAAGEGLYKLFLALRPGGPVDRFAMRELLKGETGVTHLYYNTQGQGKPWDGRHFAIPAADAYELAACVLCHLPALLGLGFCSLPPLSTRSLEWVSHLPQCMVSLSFLDTDYTVADLREMHRRRGGRTFHVIVHTNMCTDWIEFAGVSDANTKMARVNEELGGMVWWW